LKQLADWVRGSSKTKMARANTSWKWREGMDATLTRMYESGKCSVGDIAKQIGVTAQTVYPQLRRLGLPLLGKPGCKLRNYKCYGPRYNEIIFSKKQVAVVARRNAEGWHDSKIARALGIPEAPSGSSAASSVYRLTSARLSRLEHATEIWSY
jgi:hypothetical protein